MTPTPLEVLSYLTDPLFASVVLALIGGFITFELINRIGRLP
jgi:hypothetical protein